MREPLVSMNFYFRLSGQSFWGCCGLGRGPFQKCQAFRKKKKTHSFSSNQGSVLKFENFAVIRRMNYFSVSLGFPLGAQAAECLRLCYLAGHPRGTGRQEGCLPGAGPCHTVPGMSITQRPAEPWAELGNHPGQRGSREVQEMRNLKIAFPGGLCFV